VNNIRLALSAADPGLRRLASAVRAAVSFALVAAALCTACAVLGVGWSLALPGIVVAGVGSMTIGMGPRERHRFIPLLVLAATGSLGLTLGVVVLRDPLWSAVAFFGLALAVLASTLLGPAGAISSLGAVAGFAAAAMVRPAWTDVPLAVAGVVLGAGITVLVLSVLLRYRPQSQARRIIGALRDLAEQMPLAVSGGPTTARRHLDALETAISAARARIAADPVGWPDALSRGDGGALADLGARFEPAVTSALDGDSADLDTLVRDPLLHSPESAPPARPSTLDEPHAPVALDWRRAGRSLLSIATQLLAAVALSLAVAQLIDPRHWYWAMLAAAIMLFGTTSAAASLSQGYRRMLGAVIGLPAGVLLAVLVHDNLILLSVVAVVALFFLQYVAEVAYGGTVLFLAILISVLFGQTSDDVIATLGPRLLLSLLGAVIGAGVGFAVLPTRSGATLRAHADAVMADVAATLTAMSAGARVDVVTLAGRDAFARFDTLRSEAKAALRGWPLSRNQRILDEQIGAGAVVARELRATVHDYRSRVMDKPGYRAAVDAVAAKVAAVRAELTGSRRRDDVPHAPPQLSAPEHGLVRLELAIDGLAVAVRAG
jgi:uncharacterized membrane protein YgaE (UPF0421/DUF939 family)